MSSRPRRPARLGHRGIQTRQQRQQLSRRRAAWRCSRWRRPPGTARWSSRHRLGRERDDRQRRASSGCARISRIAVRPSISGIMMSISTRSMPRSRLRCVSSASRPLRAISTSAPRGSSTLDSAKMLRTSSSTTRMRRALEGRVAVARRRSMRCALGRQARLDLVQEQRHFVEQPLGRAGALDDDRLASSAAAAASSSRDSVAPGVDDDRRERARCSLPAIVSSSS